LAAVQFVQVLEKYQEVLRAVQRVETMGEPAQFSVVILRYVVDPFLLCESLENFDSLLNSNDSSLGLQSDRAVFVPHNLARRVESSQALLEFEPGLCVQLNREDLRELLPRQPAFGEDTQQQPPQRHVQVVGTLIKAG